MGKLLEMLTNIAVRFSEVADKNLNAGIDNLMAALGTALISVLMTLILKAFSK